MKLYNISQVGYTSNIYGIQSKIYTVLVLITQEDYTPYKTSTSFTFQTNPYSEAYELEEYIKSLNFKYLPIASGQNTKYTKSDTKELPILQEAKEKIDAFLANNTSI
jgi:hypothetical protein